MATISMRRITSDHRNRPDHYSKLPDDKKIRFDILENRIVCLLCMEGLNNFILRTPFIKCCKKVYHLHCVSNLLVCPTCRKVINIADISNTFEYRIYKNRHIRRLTQVMHSPAFNNILYSCYPVMVLFGSYFLRIPGLYVMPVVTIKVVAEISKNRLNLSKIVSLLLSGACCFFLDYKFMVAITICTLILPLKDNDNPNYRKNIMISCAIITLVSQVLHSYFRPR